MVPVLDCGALPDPVMAMHAVYIPYNTDQFQKNVTPRSLASRRYAVDDVDVGKEMDSGILR